MPRLLGELADRLAPGGRLIATYFNMRHIYRLQRMLRGGEPSRHPTWLNDYPLADFRRLLEAAGLRVCNEIPSNFGLGNSPSIGGERWSARPLRLLRRVPFVQLFAHQVVFVADAPPLSRAAAAP